MIYNLTFSKPYEHILEVWKNILTKHSPNLHIRQAVPEDGKLLNIREEQKDTFDNPSMDLLIRTHAFVNMLTPINYTIFYEDRLFLMVSVVPVLEGVGEISFLTDVNFVTASRDEKKALLAAFHEALNDLPFRRLQAKVKKGFDIGTIFVERMGFTSEGVLKKYGPKMDDYIMYSLIK